MKTDKVISRISETLGCSSKTAESLARTLTSRISEEISAVEKIQLGPVRYLKLTTISGQDYWAAVERGYFISEIYKDSLNGERIYRAIR